MNNNYLKMLCELQTRSLVLGFDLKLLGSQKYVSDKLKNFSPEQLEELKEALVKNGHPRFRKEIAVNHHMPYGTTTAFAEGVKNANNRENSEAR